MNRQSMQEGWGCQIVGRWFVVKAGSELLDSSLLSFLVVSVVRSSEFFSSLDFVEKAGVDGCTGACRFAFLVGMLVMLR